MSGRDERENYVLETTMTPLQADHYRIDQQEQKARGFISVIRRIFEDAKSRGKKQYCRFWLGNLYFSSRRSPNQWFDSIDTVRYKKGFLSSPIVFKYDYAGRIISSKILKFRDGPWIEELSDAKILSDTLLMNYRQKIENDLDAKMVQKRKKRMRELGLDVDD